MSRLRGLSQLGDDAPGTPGTEDLRPAGIAASGGPPVWGLQAAGAWAAIAGVVVLAGWLWGPDVLGWVVRSSVRMPPVTAIAFVAIGVALFGLAHGRPRTVWVAGGTAGVLGTIVLAEYVVGHDLSVDDLLFHHAVVAQGGPHPGRPAVLAAAAFVVTAAAIVLAERGWVRTVQMCAGLVLVSTGVEALGYLFGTSPGLDIAGSPRIVGTAAITFVVVAVALLDFTAGRGMLRMVTAPPPARLLVRRILPLTIGLIVALHWLEQWGERAGAFDQPMGAALIVLVGSISLAAVILWAAARLASMEAGRARAVESLRALNETLEDQVQSRTRELTDDARRLEQLHHITEVVAEARFPEEAVSDLLPVVQEVLAVDTVTVLVLDRRGACLVERDSFGPALVTRSEHITVGEGFAGGIAAGRRPVVVDDIDDVDLSSPVLKTAGITSVAGVPLVAGGELVGVLHVGSCRRRHFDADTVSMLQRIAEPVAAAVERRTAHEGAERRAAQAEVLSTLSRAMQDPRPDVTAALEQAVRGVAAILDASCYGLLASGDAADKLAFSHFKAADPEAAGRLAGQMRSVVTLKGSIAERVYTDGEPVVVEDTSPAQFEGVADLAYRRLMEMIRPTCLAVLPLRGAGRVIGVLSTFLGPYPDAPGRFEADDLAFLTDLTERISLALDRLRVEQQRQVTEAALRDSEQRFRGAFDDAPVGAAVSSMEGPGRILLANDALCEMLGYSSEELTGMTHLDLAHPDDVPALGAAFTAMAAGERPLVNVEGRAVRRDRSVIWVRASSSLIVSGDGPRTRITHVEDITERKQLERELMRQALYDDLTGLANRHLFLDRLGLALEQRRREGGMVGVIYVDIDHFKDFNDSLGHDAGDQVLKEVGQRLRHAVRSVDSASRLAGDEFAVLCPKVGGVADVQRIAERLHTAVCRQMDVDGRTVAVGTSMGVAVTESPSTGLDELMGAADAAMYAAKRRGRNRWELYTEALGHEALHRHEIEHQLRDGLQQGAFRVHYQPIIDLTDERIVGTEALLRLDHPTRGLLLPGEFIDVAEDSDLIVPIGEWVMEEACRQGADWNQRFGPCEMSVNLSARQIARPALIDRVRTVLAATGLAPGFLCLEMTERVLIEAGDSINRDIRELTHDGVRLALDDFGTGYSSLTHVKRFPITTVKIDRGFIADLGQRQADTAIVHAIATLAHDLDITLTAEGIERSDQLAHLRTLHCDRAQGFLFHRPQPAAAVTELLEAQMGAHGARTG